MPSIQARILDRLVPRLHLFGEDGADLATLRRRVERTAPPVLPWARVRVTPVRDGGVEGEWLTPRHAAGDRVLLYLHGGAWVMGSVRTHRALAADLARHAGVRAFTLEYRLAPEHPYPAALDDCMAGYGWLLASGIEPGRIVVAGDSAGGNLALALLLRVRDAGMPLPAGAVLLSPVTDLGLGGESHVTRRALDPLLGRADLGAFIARYVGAHDVREPCVSPLGADLHRLPPMLIHVGDHEVLLDDAVRLGERARDAGVDARTVVWPGMMHGFNAQAPFLPEARRANREIGAFIRSLVGHTPPGTGRTTP
jgi:acetyl esterase/lipase